MASVQLRRRISRLAYRSAAGFYLYERYAKRGVQPLPADRIVETPSGRRQSVNALVTSLREYGVATIPEYYGTTFVDRLHADLHVLIDDCSNNNMPADNNLYSSKLCYSPSLARQGIMRIHNVDRALDGARTFKQDSLFSEVAYLYFGEEAVSRSTIAQLNKPGGDHLKTWHYDFYMNPLKSFLYLTDVSPESGALTALPGTHARTWRNLRRAYRHLDNENVSTDEVAATGICERAFTGKKGTVMLVDTRLIHRGDSVQVGHRCALTSYYWLASDYVPGA